MISVVASSVVGHGFEPQSNQTKDYQTGICYISTKYAAFLTSNRKDGFARNQDNMSVWSDMSTRGMLFQ